MKKLLAVLLALCVIGGAAFAQAKVAVGIDGTVTLIDQTLKGGIGYYNNSYVNGLAFSGSDADGIKGLSISLNGALVAKTAPAVANYKGYWNFFDKKVKLSIGDFSMNDYRGYSIYADENNGKLGGGQVQQFLVQIYPATGLNIGVQLPYSMTSTEVATIAKKAAFGLQYAIDKVGQARAFVNLNALKPVIGASFDYTGTENAEALVWVKADIGSSVYTGDLSGKYKMDALEIQANGLFATDKSYGAKAKAVYTVNPNVAATLAGAFTSADGYDVSVDLSYDFLNGVSIDPTVGSKKGTSFYWSVPVYFSVSL